MDPTPSVDYSQPVKRINYYVFIILFLLLVILALGYYIFTTLKNKTQISPLDSSLGVNPIVESQPVSSTSAFQYPVNPQDKSVVRAGIYYLFVGNLVEIRNQSNGLELVTDIKSNNLPKFIVTPITLVWLLKSDSKYHLVKADDLKTGQEVLISGYFDYRNSAFLTMRVSILK